MIIRIGVRDTVKELEIDVADADRDELKARIEAAIAGDGAVLWLTDRHGRDVGIPSDRVAYVDLGESSGGPRIGFGA
jgi:hypothetical protein